MRVLMLGWEFPPYISGGLGTACHGLTRAMSRLPLEILFVLPRTTEPFDPHPVWPRICVTPVPARLYSPYASPEPRPAAIGPAALPAGVTTTSQGFNRSLRVMGVGAEDGYDGDLLGKIQAYAERCLATVRDEPFDLIHAHDWMTFPAAMSVAAVSGKPLIVHVHATEFDRSGDQVHTGVCDIERSGMQAAARIIAVSGRTKRTIVERYDVPPDKVEVVYNGIADPAVNGLVPIAPRAPGRTKTVLFLGRITAQKGPSYFVRVAARVARRVDNVRFVMAGNGDQASLVREEVTALGLNGYFAFPGFLRGDEVSRAYRNADVYVMPSVSEPFGLTALEAIRNGVPVILSKASGVAEVLPRGALKVDFWDVERMADGIVDVLNCPALAMRLAAEAAGEIRELTWDRAARQCLRLYEALAA